MDHIAMAETICDLLTTMVLIDFFEFPVLFN